MKDLSQLKVAIVHDWLVGGGAERVVYELHQMFPDAPIYTSYATDEWRKKLEGKVVTGWLQHFGFLRKFLQLPRVWRFSHLDLSGYDLVISSAGNGEAKDIRVPKGTPHVCICHSPVHFYWRHYDQYMKRPGFGALNPLARLGLRLLVSPLRRRDLRAAQRPDLFIANSTHIQTDIKKYYGRDSVVVHPPVDIARFEKASKQERHGFVTAGRQVPHKHTEVIIQACNELSLPLKVIGRGPEHDRLVRLAGPTVHFLTDVTDAEMPLHFASAEAFLFASFEDFGITPIEAIATGTPVIAYKAGGALDYVHEGKTGQFFEEQTPQSLARTLQDFSLEKYSSDDIKSYARNFSRHEFQKNLSKALQHVLQ
jgi:glycosyltransferase involved in cell wall biosynthesis